MNFEGFHWVEDEKSMLERFECWIEDFHVRLLFNDGTHVEFHFGRNLIHAHRFAYDGSDNITRGLL
jgi:hypothetical protein